MSAPGGSTLWTLIDSIPDDARTDQEMPGLLLPKLARLPIPQVATFQRQLLDCMDRLLNWRLWEAADAIHGESCSGDAFTDFRLWIVAQGSEVSREALRDPDTLASAGEIERIMRLPHPWSDADYPQCASLGTVAAEAFEAIAAKLGAHTTQPLDRPAVLEEQLAIYLEDSYPEDYGADVAVHTRLPRISALRGWSL